MIEERGVETRRQYIVAIGDRAKAKGKISTGKEECKKAQ